ncbi:MAG: cadherin-like domain-containing protein, partial [Vicinamibacterales bacterium]
TVTIQVTPVNDPPVANPGSKTTPEDTPVSGLLTSSDNDGGAPVYSLASGTSHGTVVVNADGSYTYTPAPDYNGPDSFTFTVVDGNGGSATSTVTLTVTPVNDKPVAVDDSYTGQWNTLLTVAAPGVLTNDSDVDGNTLTAIKLTNPGSGTLVFSANGSLTFMPTANWSGTVSFTYKANDGSLDSNVATVKIRITSPCGNSGDGRSNDGRSDDGRSDDRSGKSGKSRDGRRGDGRSNDGRSDDHSSDDHSNDSGCTPGTPIAHKDHYTTKKNTSLTVLANKGVLKNDNAFSVNAQLFAAPTRGTVVLAANGSFLYTPMPGFVGDDFFTYVPRSASGDNCDHDKKKNKHKKGDNCDHDKDHD